MTGNQGGNYEAILWTRTGNGCGTVIGAAAISGLHAQARPPGFLVTEIDVTNPEGLRQRVRPQGNIKAAGGRFVALGRDWGVGAKQVTALSGTPPKRATIIVWDNFEALNAWFNSAEYQAVRKIGAQYATFRSYAVDGQ